MSDEDEPGMVTVETAIGIAAIVAVLALCLGAIGVVRGQGEVCAATREAARAAMVGKSPQDAASQAVSRPVTVEVSRGGNWINVTGRAEVAMLTLGFPLQCSLTTQEEPWARN